MHKKGFWGVHIFRGLSARELASITFDEWPSFFLSCFLLPSIPYPPGVKKGTSLNVLKKRGGFWGSKANEHKIELLAAGETRKALYNLTYVRLKTETP